MNEDNQPPPACLDGGKDGLHLARLFHVQRQQQFGTHRRGDRFDKGPCLGPLIGQRDRGPRIRKSLRATCGDGLCVRHTQHQRDLAVQHAHACIT